MYGIDEFYENYELSPIETLVSEFRDKCVEILMTDVNSDINSLVESNNNLIRENNEYKKQIAALENEIATNTIIGKKNKLYSFFFESILDNYSTSCNTTDEKTNFIFDFCSLLFTTDIPVSNIDKSGCPIWLTLSVKYYTHKKEIIDILNYFNIKYPNNINTLRLPHEWNEQELDVFFANMYRNYVCNGNIYDDNLRHWYPNALYSIEKQCSLSYSEIPWQLLLRNPLLHKEKYLRLIGENLFSRESNWNYFEKLTQYQEYLPEEMLILIKSIDVSSIKASNHIRKSFINFIKPYVDLIKNEKKLLDKYFEYLCEEDYQIKYTSILLSMPIEYIQRWFSKQSMKICLEFITRHEKELISLFGENIKKELLEYVIK